MKKLDEVLQEVNAFLDFYLIDLEQVLETERKKPIGPLRGGSNAGGRTSCHVTQPHLAHLQLEEASLFLHVLGNLAAAELGADHAMLPGVFPLLLLNLRPAASQTRS